LHAVTHRWSMRGTTQGDRSTTGGSVRSSEIHALGGLAGQAFSRPAGLARDVHDAVARRAFGALGVLAAPVRLLHDGISSAVYRAVGAGLRAPLVAGASALARTAPPGAPPLADSPRGSLVLGALNGAIGDALARDQRHLALELTLRGQGKAVPTDRTALAAAFPEATAKIVVFVHGLCETEEAWRLAPLGRRHSERSYGSRLREELGYTPLYVRYNSGLHVSDNGRRLAAVIEDVVLGWPVEVEEIALVGHSMGGLVARSACHYGQASHHAWTGRLRHVFCLGAPHLGAPLEKAANLTGWTLGRVAETRPFAAIVNARSAGIKDLRFGNCVEEDWCDCDPDEFLRDRCREVPFVPTTTYYFIGATLTRDSDSPLAQVMGDLFVRLSSASGRGRRRRIPFEIDNGSHLGGLNHFQLLNHPVVYRQIRNWLEGPSRPAGVARPT
jgi:pimeloyl-ACP methyl ester carboxylesterase